MELTDHFRTARHFAQLIKDQSRYKEMNLFVDGELNASSGRPQRRCQRLVESVAVKDDTCCGCHPARFPRRSARIACFSDSRKSESSSSLMPLRAKASPIGPLMSLSDLGGPARSSRCRAA